MPSFLPDLPEDLILAALKSAPGNEVRSGKIDGPESSSALVSNAFGWFLERPKSLPPLPGVPAGQALSVTLAAEMRFPWSGGRHPWMDVGIETTTTLIGIESKRYEPFRPLKNSGFAEVYDRPVWGEKMGRYTKLRDQLVAGEMGYETLDAVELIKQAYGLYTQSQKRALGAVLVYLYAEPGAWASGKPVDAGRIALHREELADFADRVGGDSVVFAPLHWVDLLSQWQKTPALTEHVEGLRDWFGPLG